MSRNLRKARYRGATLLELTIVIMVLLTIIGVSMYSAGSISDWKKGREATEALRAVYAAQRGYLADHPTTPLSSLTPDMIAPYLPTGAVDADGNKVMPTVETLEGNTLPIKVDVSPPVIDDGSEGGYDPTRPRDSLWDVGE